MKLPYWSVFNSPMGINYLGFKPLEFERFMNEAKKQ